MEKIVFVYKENNSDDRDCVFYTDVSRINGKLECGHYFPSMGLMGACFSKGLNLENIDFDNITTILTKEEFEQWDKFNKEINNLGYGIKEGDERYQRGRELIKGIQPIIDKLQSEENERLFKKVQEEEIRYLLDNYELDEEEIEYIFDNYGLGYRDRGIVGAIFEDKEEVGQEYMDGTGGLSDLSDFEKRFFNYEEFGESLVNNNNSYLELPDGRIVSLMY